MHFKNDFNMFWVCHCFECHTILSLCRTKKVKTVKVFATGDQIVKVFVTGYQRQTSRTRRFLQQLSTPASTRTGPNSPTTLTTTRRAAPPPGQQQPRSMPRYGNPWSPIVIAFRPLYLIEVRIRLHDLWKRMVFFHHKQKIKTYLIWNWWTAQYRL